MTVFTEHDRNWWLERLDAALDGELGAVERERFLALAEQDPLLADEWALARAVQKTLAADEAPACPARVHAGIEAHVRASLREERAGRAAGHADRSARRGSRYADRAPWKGVAAWRGIAAVAVVAAITVLVATLRLGAPTISPMPAPAPNATVARATQDVQWALAFVSDVGRDAVSAGKNR